jgi:hypothetical protein
MTEARGPGGRCLTGLFRGVPPGRHTPVAANLEVAARSPLPTIPRLLQETPCVEFSISTAVGTTEGLVEKWSRQSAAGRAGAVLLRADAAYALEGRAECEGTAVADFMYAIERDGHSYS